MRAPLCPWLVWLSTGGCLFGVRIEPVAPVQVVGTPVLEAPLEAAQDGILYARAGDTVAVRVQVSRELDLEATTVGLGGATLVDVEELGDQTYRFSRTLDGSEQSGTKVLVGTLADTLGLSSRIAFDSSDTITVVFDFVPPAAGCTLVPAQANGEQPVTFTVVSSEALAGGTPTVTTTDPRVRVTRDEARSEGDQHVFDVALDAPADVASYGLRATGTDLAGNAQTGDSLCSELVEGAILGLPPLLTGTPTLVASTRPGQEGARWADVDGTPWVRAGARLTLTLPVDKPLDLQRSLVTLSGLPFVPAETPHTWTYDVTGSEVPGRKTLDARLVDVVGNTTAVRSEELATPVEAVVDLVPPDASCLLVPPQAKGGDSVLFTVLASEALQGGTPGVSFAEPDLPLAIRHAASEGTRHTFQIEPTEAAGVDVTYTLQVEATDLVGNAATGLCAVERRTGAIVTTPPAVDGTVVLVADVFVAQPSGLDLVGPGATLTLTLPTAAPVDPTLTTVSLSGVRMEPVPGTEGEGEPWTANQWTVTLTGTEGDGAKTLSARLVDDAGNVTSVQDQSPAIPQQVGVVLDSTPPVADCLLTPALAPADAEVAFSVFVSEAQGDGFPLVAPLAGAPVAVEATATTTGRHDFTLSPTTSGEDFSYVLDVTLSDPVGNRASGCTIERRSGTFDVTPPDLAGKPILEVAGSRITPQGYRRARTEAAVTMLMQVTEPLDLQRTFVSFGGISLAYDAAAVPPVWRGIIPATATDGAKVLSAVLVDQAGNERAVERADVGIVVDTTPPSAASAGLRRLPAFAPADTGTGTLTVSERDPVTGEPVRVELDVVLNEALPTDGVPELTASAPDLTWATPTRSATNPRKWTWAFQALPADTPTTEFHVVLEDDLGNRTDPPELLDARLVVDRDAPLRTPRVDTSLAIVYHRAPWGSAQGAPPAFEVVGAPGAVRGGAVVILRDRAGGYLDQATAAPDGSFTGLASPNDVAEVWIEELDDAGNPSTSVRVRDGVWTARLDGKRPGRTAENPHTLYDQPWASAALEAPGQAEATLPVAGLAAGHTTSGTMRWRRHTTSARELGLSDGADLERMTWDPARGVVVAYGTADGEALIAEWNGTRWRVVARGGGPGARSEPGFAYDPGTERVLLFGGRAGVDLDDTWSWDGASWTELTPLQGEHPPPPRGGALLVTDPEGQRVVLLDARRGLPEADPPPDDAVWTWSDGAWTSTPVEGDAPLGRDLLAAWDPLLGGVLVQETADAGGAPTGRTLLWDGAAWSDVTPQDPWSLAAPDAAMVTDEVAGAPVIVVRPVPDLGLPVRVFAWDGADWVDRTDAGDVASPSRVGPGSLAFDGTRGRVLQTAVTPALQTWTWDGAHWTDLSPVDQGPADRTDHALVAAPGLDQVLLHGGTLDAPGGPADDTWTWDGARWTPHPAASGPAATEHAAAWSPDEDQVVLFAGEGDLPGTVGVWTWDGIGWTQVAGIEDGPEGPRTHAAAVSDPASGEVLVSGGEVAGEPLADLWRWSTVAGWSSEAAGPPRARAWSGHGLVLTPEAGHPLHVAGRATGGDLGAESTITQDVFRWTGSAWVSEAEPAPFPARAHHAVAADDTRNLLVIHGGVGTSGLLADLWARVDGAWLQVHPAGATPGSRAGHRLAPDATGGLLTFGGASSASPAGSETWRLDTGGQARPAQRLDLDWTHADVPDAALVQLEARWTAGGHGRPDDADLHGAALKLWDRTGWRALDQHAAAPDAPAVLCWVGRAPGADAPLPGDCDAIEEDLDLDPLFSGLSRQRLHLAAETVAPSGVATPAAPFARLRTTDVEVRVHYRHPLPQGVLGDPLSPSGR